MASFILAFTPSSLGRLLAWGEPGDLLIKIASALILVALVSLFVRRKKPTQTVMDARLDANKYLSSLPLKEVADYLDINDSDIRVSLYRAIDGDGFVLAGRYSESPSMNSSGEAYYPNTKGFLADAWSNGNCVKRNFLSREDPKWGSTMKEQGYRSLRIARRRFRVDIRSYVAVRIGSGANAKGILCIESTLPAGKVSGVLMDKVIRALGDDRSNAVNRVAQNAL